MALKTMPVAKLRQLKSQVEAAISAKVSERRRLANLTRPSSARGKRSA
jgi:hypothetical protein